MTDHSDTTSLESIPISAINTYLYCPRRAGLIFNELVFTHNHHTVRGQYLHQRTDLPGTHNLKDVAMIRSLSIWSKTLGIHGRCDIVEQHSDGTYVPVEYKKGKLRAFDNDDAQVCAQGLCLEEMFHTSISHGVIFHASSKHRRKVPFTTALRSLTKNTIQAIRTLIHSKDVPKAVHSPKCAGCSLNQHCLPTITSSWSYSKQRIFTPKSIPATSDPS